MATETQHQLTDFGFPDLSLNLTNPQPKAKSKKKKKEPLWHQFGYTPREALYKFMTLIDKAERRYTYDINEPPRTFAEWVRRTHIRIILRYSSTCWRCGREIPKGQVAWWNCGSLCGIGSAFTSTYHETCYWEAVKETIEDHEEQ